MTLIPLGLTPAAAGTDAAIQNKIYGSGTTVLGISSEEMEEWLSRWIPNPGVPCSNPRGGSKVDSAFHPSEVDKMSTRNFWELSGKK